MADTKGKSHIPLEEGQSKKESNPGVGHEEKGSKGYSTFEQGQGKTKQKEGRFARMKTDAGKKMGVIFLPKKHEPPRTVDFMKRRFPKAWTHGKVKWFTVVYLAVLYVSYHMSRLPFSIAKTVLHPDCSAMEAALTLTNAQVKDACGWAPFDKPNYALLFGVLDYAFTFTYSITLLLVSGPLAERLRPRSFLAVGIFMSGVSTALFGLGYHLQIHSLWYYIVCMILLGLFQSTGLPTIISILSEWTTSEARGKTIGIWSISMFLGNILGAVIPAQFVTDNWATAFYVPGGCMMLLSFITPFLVFSSPKEVGFTRDGKDYKPKGTPEGKGKPEEKDRPEKTGESPTTETVVDEPSSNEEAPLVAVDDDEAAELDEMADNRSAISWMDAFKVSGVIEFSACLFFVKLVSYTALYWLPKMMSIKGFSPEDASYLTAIFDAGGMLGALSAGILSDRLDYAALIVSGALAAGTPPLLALNYLDGYSSVGRYIILLSVAGVLVNGPYAYIVSVVASRKGADEEVESHDEKKGTATVSGIIDGIGSFGGALGPLIAGYVAGMSYDYIIYIFVISLGLGILVLSRQIVLDFMRLCGCSSTTTTDDSDSETKELT